VRNHMAMRYVGDDDFGSPKNAFVICTFWMINALYLIGREKEARDMFDHILKHMNPLGLYSEGVEPDTGRLVGNFPQGYSHMAFIQTVLLLESNYSWHSDDHLSGLTIMG
jgi:alpha,alpha-trehalase